MYLQASACAASASAAVHHLNQLGNITTTSARKRPFSQPFQSLYPFFHVFGRSHSVRRLSAFPPRPSCPCVSVVHCCALSSQGGVETNQAAGRDSGNGDRPRLRVRRRKKCFLWLPLTWKMLLGVCFSVLTGKRRKVRGVGGVGGQRRPPGRPNSRMKWKWCKFMGNEGQSQEPILRLLNLQLQCRQCCSGLQRLNIGAK
jgi:hypothetical protein